MRTILTLLHRPSGVGTLRAASPYGSARTSPQRLEISRAASEFAGAFTAEELAARLRAEGAGVGLATVYRALAALEASEYITRAGSRDGAALYVCCDATGHHHHLVCERCGSVAHAECPVDDSLVKGARSKGFELTHHEITLYGLCSQCRTASGGDD